MQVLTSRGLHAYPWGMNKWSSPRIDPSMAQDLLDDGQSVREVALKFGVSMQAVYDAIRRGRIKRGSDDS